MNNLQLSNTVFVQFWFGITGEKKTEEGREVCPELCSAHVGFGSAASCRVWTAARSLQRPVKRRGMMVWMLDNESKK